MSPNSKLKTDWLFWLIALILLVLVIIYVASAVGFLAKKLNAAVLQDNTDQRLIIRFDFDSFNKALAGKILN